MDHKDHENVEIESCEYFERLSEFNNLLKDLDEAAYNLYSSSYSRISRTYDLNNDSPAPSEMYEQQIIAGELIILQKTYNYVNNFLRNVDLGDANILDFDLDFLAYTLDESATLNIIQWFGLNDYFEMVISISSDVRKAHEALGELAKSFIENINLSISSSPLNYN